MIYDVLQRAIEANPHKKGVRLYRMITGDLIHYWAWARTSQEALSKVTRNMGITATPHVFGVNIDSGGF